VETLLAGEQGVVYSLVTHGEPDPARQRLAAQPWISNLHLAQVNGDYRWTVAVNDPAAAQAQLLRLVMQDDWIEVLEYGQQKLELEEIFMRLVQENEK
jgi:hypothetical protein